TLAAAPRIARFAAGSACGVDFAGMVPWLVFERLSVVRAGLFANRFAARWFCADWRRVPDEPAGGDFCRSRRGADLGNNSCAPGRGAHYRRDLECRGNPVA